MKMELKKCIQFFGCLTDERGTGERGEWYFERVILLEVELTIIVGWSFDLLLGPETIIYDDYKIPVS